MNNEVTAEDMYEVATKVKKEREEYQNKARVERTNPMIEKIYTNIQEKAQLGYYVYFFTINNKDYDIGYIQRTLENKGFHITIAQNLLTESSDITVTWNKVE